MNREDESNRYCIQLYQHLISGVDLKGRDVLEIACGRGGGASFIARYLKPVSLAGIGIAVGPSISATVTTAPPV